MDATMQGVRAPSKKRHLPLVGTYNVRDVGGYRTADGRKTRWHVLLRADSLHRLDTSGQQMLRDMLVRTVVDLRNDPEVADAPNVFAGWSGPGPRYVREPLSGDPTLRPAVDLPMDQTYRWLLRSASEQIARIVTTLAQPDALPALVHCTAGKDRTGLIVALLLAVAGVDAATISEDYALSSTYLTGSYFDEARVRAEKASIPWEVYRERLVCPPGFMLDTLAWLSEEYGGAIPYLLAAGVSASALSTLRGSLVEPAGQ